MGTSIKITGWGAVSPAGWRAGDLADAVLSDKELPWQAEQRCAEATVLECRRVSPPPAAEPWLKQPRLRRASAISRFAMAAAWEALGGVPETAGNDRLGVLFAVQNGSVNFSRRFYEEVLATPGLASPILFPETVFNAPASHLSHSFQATGHNHTLVGDTGAFVMALDVAAQWLLAGQVDRCLIVSSEELDWLSAEALLLVPGQKRGAEGAAAVVLSLTDEPQAGDLLIEQITEPTAITNRQDRPTAIRRMREQLEAPVEAALVSAASGSPFWDKASLEVFTDWRGDVYALQERFGHAFSVLGGWQCALACELLKRERHAEVVVSADTGASQATAAWFRRFE